MKVGTDGVLLGAWTDVKQAKRILDIGTGTGLLALMLAQRSNAEIDAIEIDSEAAEQACENINHSPWSHRIRIIHTSFQEFAGIKKKYDLIVSNPPYFINSLKTPDKKRSLARHDHELNHKSLTEGVKILLAGKGRFDVVLPADNFRLFCESMNNNGLYVSRQTNIYSNPESSCIRVLAEFSHTNSIKNSNDIVIETGGRHQYSTQYSELVKEYFLNY